jgi:hypothetical protein
MTQEPRARRGWPSALRWLGAAGWLLAIGPCPNATAQPLPDPKKQACADSYDNSQRLRDQGQHTLARAQLRICTEACPAGLAADCRAWLGDLEATLPSVRLAARDASGRSIDATVSIDGEPAGPVPREPLRLEPGTHRFRFERPSDGAMVERSADLAARGREQSITATFGAVDTGELSQAEVAAAVLAAAGGTALVAAGALAIKGHVARGDLYDCRPRCSEQAVDAVATTWTVAGVVAAAGGAVLGTALVVWLLDEPSASAEPATVSFGPDGWRVEF